MNFHRVIFDDLQPFSQTEWADTYTGDRDKLIAGFVHCMRFIDDPPTRFVFSWQKIPAMKFHSAIFFSLVSKYAPWLHLLLFLPLSPPLHLSASPLASPLHICLHKNGVKARLCGPPSGGGPSPLYELSFTKELPSSAASQSASVGSVCQSRALFMKPPPSHHNVPPPAAV